MANRKPIKREDVFRVLEDSCGMMTSEVCDELGLDRDRMNGVRSVLDRMYKDGIVDKEWDGTRIHPRLRWRIRPGFIGKLTKRNGARVPVIMYDMDGVEIARFESFKVASETTGITPRSIAQAANGVQMTAGGYMWRRLDGGHLPVLRKDVEIMRAIKENGAITVEGIVGAMHPGIEGKPRTSKETVVARRLVFLKNRGFVKCRRRHGPRGFMESNLWEMNVEEVPAEGS